MEVPCRSRLAIAALIVAVSACGSDPVSSVNWLLNPAVNRVVRWQEASNEIAVIANGYGQAVLVDAATREGRTLLEAEWLFDFELLDNGNVFAVEKAKAGYDKRLTEYFAAGGNREVARNVVVSYGGEGLFGGRGLLVSRHGGRLAFVVAPDTLYTVSTLARPETVSAGCSVLLDWSPDGEEILCSPTRYLGDTVHVIRISDAVVTEIPLPDDAFEDGGFVWGPNGPMMISARGTIDLTTMEKTTTGLGSHLNSVPVLGWSTDGSVIVRVSYTIDRTDSSLWPYTHSGRLLLSAYRQSIGEWSVIATHSTSWVGNSSPATSYPPTLAVNDAGGRVAYEHAGVLYVVPVP